MDCRRHSKSSVASKRTAGMRTKMLELTGRGSDGSHSQQPSLGFGLHQLGQPVDIPFHLSHVVRLSCGAEVGLEVDDDPLSIFNKRQIESTFDQLLFTEPEEQWKLSME